MAHYLVLAAVRIQTWLARTPRLALIRGASRALHEATSTETVTQVLAAAGLGDAARVAEDAGDVDGVMVLQVDGGRVDGARRALREHVHRSLPGLEWTLWDGQSSTVLDALASSRGHGELILGELITVPFARRCQGCGAETGVRASRVADEELLLGPDCLSRWAGGKTSWLPGHSYRDGLNIPGDGPPRTMEDLARANGNAAEQADRYRGKRNHAAVVCADGNSIGELFGAIPAEHRRHAVAALDQATRDALSAAAADVTDQSVVVEPHFVGGDDILVSVPAPLAWAFTLNLAARFDQFLGHYLAQVAAPAAVPASLGVGLCFSHAAYPFAQAREIAFAAMKQAKQGVRGRQAAVGWADLTADDNVVPGRFRTVSRLRDLRSGHASGGDLLVGSTNSARAEISAEIDRGAGRFDTDEAALHRLANYARRTNDDLLEHWLSTTSPAEAVADLRSGISLARWWPGPHATPPSADGTEARATHMVGGVGR